MHKTTLGTAVTMLLIVFLAAGIIFVPAVSAKPDKGKDWSNPQIVKDEIDKLANAGDQQKQEEAFKKLPPEGQKAIIEGLKFKEVKITESSGLTIASLGSNTKERTFTGYSYLGSRLFAYTQSITWWYDGFRVTETPFRRITGSTYALFWTFNGNINNVEGGGKGQFYYRAYTQGQFKYCVSTYGCIQEVDPWIDMTVYGNGGYTSSAGR